MNDTFNWDVYSMYNFILKAKLLMIDQLDYNIKLHLTVCLM